MVKWVSGACERNGRLGDTVVLIIGAGWDEGITRHRLRGFDSAFAVSNDGGLHASRYRVIMQPRFFTVVFPDDGCHIKLLFTC